MAFTIWQSVPRKGVPDYHYRVIAWTALMRRSDSFRF